MRWEDVLSLGEQQRMGVARMYYHSPRFAVLDECTSAVSVDVEEKLYREAANLGITCITLSQHMTLPEFNPQELVPPESKPNMGRPGVPPFSARTAQTKSAFCSPAQVIGENCAEGWSIREVDTTQKNALMSAAVGSENAQSMHATDDLH